MKAIENIFVVFGLIVVFVTICLGIFWVYFADSPGVHKELNADPPVVDSESKEDFERSVQIEKEKFNKTIGKKQRSENENRFILHMIENGYTMKQARDLLNSFH